MTAQGIMSGAGSPMNAVFPGFPAAGGSVRGTQDTSFEQFMETSRSTSKDAKTEAVPTEDANVTSPEPQNVRERAKALFSGEGKVKEAQPSKPAQESGISEEAAEAVSTLLVQIKQVICDTLGITGEQLTEAMDELGLKEADVLDRDNLQQLVLTLNEAEPTEFLTNEELFDDFAGLVQAVEQTVEESEFTPEKVRTVLKALEEAPVTVETEELPKTENHMNVMTEQDTVEEDAEEVPAEPVEPAEAVPSEIKAEVGNTGEREGHKTEARKENNTTTISSETDVNVRTVFIDALAENAVSRTEEGASVMATQVREIANQIMEQIRITIRPEQTNMELQLNPEHLGRVHLTITEKEGMMTAQFTTQSEVAKEAIESQMAAFRESLQNQGIKVEAIEVTVSEFGFGRNDESGRNGSNEPEQRQGRRGFRAEETEDAAPQMADYFNVTDSSVDYSA